MRYVLIIKTSECNLYIRVCFDIPINNRLHYIVYSKYLCHSLLKLHPRNKLHIIEQLELWMCFYIKKPKNISLIVGPTLKKTHPLTFLWRWHSSALYSLMFQLINLKILLWSLNNGKNKVSLIYCIFNPFFFWMQNLYSMLVISVWLKLQLFVLVCWMVWSKQSLEDELRPCWYPTETAR